jgi:hypothetical protein
VEGKWECVGIEEVDKTRVKVTSHEIGIILLIEVRQ